MGKSRAGLRSDCCDYGSFEGTNCPSIDYVVNCCRRALLPHAPVTTLTTSIGHRWDAIVSTPPEPPLFYEILEAPRA